MILLRYVNGDKRSDYNRKHIYEYYEIEGCKILYTLYNAMKYRMLGLDFYYIGNCGPTKILH